MRNRALAALVCVLLSILLARAAQLPLTIKEISLMLRSGYSSNAIMQELAIRYFAEKLDVEKEKTLLQAGASAELITALKSGKYSLSSEQMTIAQQQIADQTQKARKPWDTCILLTGVDGLCRNGKLFAVILVCQLHISI